MTDVLIIGGGIAGLTTAFRLQQAGRDVVLLEKGDRLGGAILTRQTSGYLTEMGPNTVLETSPRVTELIKDAGLEEKKIYANDTSKIRYIVRDKKPVPLPASPPAFFASKLFSRRAKLRLLKEPFIAAWDNAYEESLAQFVLRRLGREFLDYAINPFVAGVYAGKPDHLSVKHGFPKLYALEQTYGSLIRGQIKGAKARRQREETAKQSARMFSFTAGLQALPSALGDALKDRILTDYRVSDIRPENHHYSVTCQTSGGQPEKLQARTVIYTGPTYGLKSLTIGDKVVPEFEALQAVHYPPVTVLHLGFKREEVDHPLEGFGMLIPEAERFHILGALFSSSLFPGRAPEGQVLLTVFLGGMRQAEQALKDEEHQTAIALKDLNVLLGVRGAPVFVGSRTWTNAIPQYHVGYGEMKVHLDTLEQRYPGLFFAGAYRNGISVADTIVNAWDTVEKIQSFFMSTQGE